MAMPGSGKSLRIAIGTKESPIPPADCVGHLGGRGRPVLARRAGQRSSPERREPVQRKKSPFLSLFVLSGSSMGWMRPTHSGKTICSTNSNSLI